MYDEERGKYSNRRGKHHHDTDTSDGCNFVHIQIFPIVCIVLLVIGLIASIIVSSLAFSKVKALEISVTTLTSQSEPLQPTLRKHFVLPARSRQLTENTFGLGKAYIKHQDKWVDGYVTMLRAELYTYDPHVKNERKRSKHKTVSNTIDKTEKKKTTTRRSDAYSPASPLEENISNKGGGSEKDDHYVTGTCWSTIGDNVAKIVPGMNFGVDTTNGNGLSGTYIKESIVKAMEAWDCQTGYHLFGSLDEDMVVDGADTDAPDGKNEIMFGPLPWPGVIAVTITWVDWANGRIIEVDQVYDDVHNTFGLSDDTLNFKNIATHELGHWVGMGDEYDSECSDVTMYGYASVGETKKITLELADIEGLIYIYGLPTKGSCANTSKSNGQKSFLRITFTLVIICILFLLIV